MKTFKTFDEMMVKLKGLTYEESQQLGLNLDDHGEYASLQACYPNQEQCNKILKEHKLNVITYSIYDLDDGGSCYSYATGFHLVNREMWLFCRSKTQGMVDEIEEDEIEE